jgi:membrane-bound hydrogenase subunit beta
MVKMNDVVSRLESRFTALTGCANVVNERRIFLDVPLESLTEILRCCNDELGFTHLCTITGLDNGETFEFLYHISQESGVVLTLKVKTPRDNGVLPSVIPIYNGAIFYELELEGLLGVVVEGLPADRQYPLPDNWPKGEYPMRKDWKPKAGTPPLDNP